MKTPLIIILALATVLHAIGLSLTNFAMIAGVLCFIALLGHSLWDSKSSRSPSSASPSRTEH